jgi:internalin A
VKSLNPQKDTSKRILKSGSSRVIVKYVLSPTFLASDFIKNNELPPLLNAAKVDGLTIIWIPTSDSNYKYTEIASYQAAHDPNKPLDGLKKSERNKAFVKICDIIIKATKKYQTKGHSPNHSALKVQRLC